MPALSLTKKQATLLYLLGAPLIWPGPWNGAACLAYIYNIATAIRIHACDYVSQNCSRSAARVTALETVFVR